MGGEMTHEREIAQLKIEQANREALDAFVKLSEARRLMLEAGATEKGIEQVTRAMHEASGWTPEEFMPDMPQHKQFGAYFDERYVDDVVPDSRREVFGSWLAGHFNHRQFKELTIKEVGGSDPDSRAFELRWTFWNDGRFGYIGDAEGGK